MGTSVDFGSAPCLAWTFEAGKPASVTAPQFDGIGDTCKWLTSTHPEIMAGLREYGAVYLRGLPVNTVDSVAMIRDVFIPQRTPYREKATPRSSFGKDIYSSTDLPPSQPIRMHNENSYTLTFPGLLMFACLTAPEEGGATPVADCRRILRSLPSELVERMRATGWILTRNYSEHISLDWRTVFASDSKEQVEEYCGENLISCNWDDADHLRTAQLRPGIVRHPETGEEVWFNHLAFWNSWALDPDIREALIDEFGPGGLPFETSFGDGARLTQEELEVISAAYAEATVRETWQPGDIMLVDNILTAHGRDSFQGDRKIVVAMGAPVDIQACRPTVAPAATRL
ncbi:TauD/TfdA family dioxygenase [Streptomyces cyanogenus]|uniref:Peptide synthase n=1 Tax=Streptomyces cyanogenus TaxID=80860 RepID=A0ABX7TXF6_STRCY|nr:TauD/TfdA family dioxygenase [Streptomyces cyanogenus]QTE01455.1 peptide synthase [Streptomyces cyanogenus]